MKLWFGLAAKSLRNRWFTTLLTIFSIALSVALLLGVERVRLGARESFNNTISQTDLVVGARGSPLQLLLYTVFHLGEPTSNISYATYQHFKSHPSVEWTIPISLGDSHGDFRVVATNENFYAHYRFRGEERLAFSAGHEARDIFDVVIGAAVAKELHYQPGAAVVLSHGISDGFQKHEDKPFRVVGILQRTGTPIDRALYITLAGMEAIHIDWKDGAPPRPGEGTPAAELRADKLPIGQITSFFLRTKSRITALYLQQEINAYAPEPLQAVMPGVGLARLWDLLSFGETALQVVSLFVVGVGFVSMLIAIYTSLNERRREMSILRALGTGPKQILFLLLVESTLLTALGVGLGTTLVYFSIWVFQPWLVRDFGLYLPFSALSSSEMLYLFGLILGGFLVGLVPAIKAYRNVVADGLTIKV